jgi:hypothetical protein
MNKSESILSPSEEGANSQVVHEYVIERVFKHK